MAKLSMFVVCDNINNINVNAGGEIRSVPQLTAPQVVLRPMFIPGSFSFGIAAGVVGVNLQEKTKVRFTIANPEGKIINDSGETEFPIIDQADSLPTEYQGFMLSMDIRNIVFEMPGDYIFTLFVNGEEAGSHEIPVFEGNKL